MPRLREEEGPLLLSGGFGPVWAAVPPLWREPVRTTSRFVCRLRGTKDIAGERPGSSAAPPAGHTAPQCGARQRVAGSSAGGRKWGQKREGDITLAVNIPEALLSQGKNRGQSGDCPGFPERRTSLWFDIPSKIAAPETIGPPPKIDTQFKEKGIAANAALLTMN